MMKNKFLAVIVGISILFTSVAVCAQDFGKIKTTINGIEVKTAYPPVYLDGSVYVPLREFANLLEYDVFWIQSENAVKLVKMDEEIKMTIGSKKVTTTFGDIELVKEPFILSGSTYVPLSAIDKCFGFYATFSEVSRSIAITQNTGFISKNMVPDVLTRDASNVLVETLLENGDFEDGTTGWSHGYGAAISATSDDVHSGDTSLLLEMSDGLATVNRDIWSILKENGPGTYVFEFWAKANKEGHLVVYCPKFTNAKYMSGSASLTKEWQKFTLEKYLTWTDKDNITTATLTFGHDNAAYKALTVWLDDIVITKK